MDGPLVEVRGLRVGYPELVTLEHARFSIGRGEISCIIGGSGCGKSTLLRCLIGLLPPLGGTVEMMGRDLYAMDESDRFELLRRVGVLFQHGALLNSLTLEENVMIPMREHTRMPVPVMRETALVKLRQVGLEHAAQLFPDQLSGGMRKRAALARALALDPDLLFCDEPSAGLDPATGADLDRLLLDLRRVFRIAIVVVTHELHSIKAIADRVIMLEPGRMVFHGSLDEALASDLPEMVSFFGREAPPRQERRSLLEMLTEEA